MDIPSNPYPTGSIITCSTLVLYFLSILPCTPTYSVQNTVLPILRSADNVCRGHAARGTLAGKAVCEWWSGRAVAPISGVFFYCFFFALPVPLITDCYIVQQRQQRVALNCTPEVAVPDREDKHGR